MMSIAHDIVRLLLTILQLDGRNNVLTPSSPLLGSIPEFDSIAVVDVISALEEHFGFVVDDDEINADTFASVDNLSRFVEYKLKTRRTATL
jgi:acyl carrier protein